MNYFNTIADLKATQATEDAFCHETKKKYIYDINSTETPDDVDVLTTAAGYDTRWISTEYDAKKFNDSDIGTLTATVGTLGTTLSTLSGNVDTLIQTTIPSLSAALSTLTGDFEAHIGA